MTMKQINITTEALDSTTNDYKERCLLLEKECDELEEENHTLEMEVQQLLQELREK
jgi:prefoldin subunit 5